MNAPRPSSRPNPLDRIGLNPLLQFFLTIIAGTVVAVIAWAIVERFLNIIVLLIASFVVAFLLDPLVSRLQRSGVPRALSILLIYLVLFGVIAGVTTLLLGPLIQQLQGLLRILPSLTAKAGLPAGVVHFLQEHGIKLNIADLRNQLVGYISSAGTTLLGSTLAIVTGVVTTVTDLLLILAITFYLLLDGHAMHNRAIRLLPTAYRDRWFFFEAALNKVLGGYIRGQLIVALTVGTAAGLGCWLLGVNYPLVIGLLAFLFELIPMIGPVLGMLPAVLIALFQSPSLTMWVVVYFIILQQVESNVIVPRVSGHAVGLHPLAALLALLVGVELGGLGGALLSVPLAGVLWVLAMALYANATGQMQVATGRPRTTPYTFVTQRLIRRGAASAVSNQPAMAAVGAAANGPVPVANERLETIKQEQEHLIKQFEEDEEKQAAVEHSVPPVAAASGQRPPGPDDTQAPHVM